MGAWVVMLVCGRPGYVGGVFSHGAQESTCLKVLTLSQFKKNWVEEPRRNARERKKKKSAHVLPVLLTHLLGHYISREAKSRVCCFEHI